MTSTLVRLLAVSFTVSIAAAQQPASQDATLQALLKEVHELRITLERSNLLGPRVQIALAKMQFEEERMRSANARLLDAHARVMDLQNKIVASADQIKQTEARQAQSADATERKQLALEIDAQKHEMEQLGTLQQQYQAQESEANSAAINEQARWNEANDLLTSIERLMAPAQP